MQMIGVDVQESIERKEREEGFPQTQSRLLVAGSAAKMERLTSH